MANKTQIQWCDSTVNPIMGCAGCELFPRAASILTKIDEAVSAKCGDWVKDQAKETYETLIGDAYAAITEPSEHHKNAVTTSNLYHLREKFVDAVKKDYGEDSAEAARRVLEEQVTCYAAKWHLRRGYSLVNPTRKTNKGFAPTFEQPTQFGGKVRDAAELSDLLGQSHPKEPWKDGLARMIFVSDMGDAFSDQKDFEFLEKDVIPAINSELGQKHIWLWVTKQPHRMAEFAEHIGGFPDNVCVMTTLTSADAVNQMRLRDIKTVKATMRGLSIEPLWGEIKPEELDLDRIDWVIVGGESGASKYAHPFHVEWAQTLHAHCKDKGVAFFLKQLGSNPQQNGMALKLKDAHGGDWSEWGESLHVREFPQVFHDFRKEELEALEKQQVSLPRRNEATRRTEGGPLVKAKAVVLEPLNETESSRLDQLEGIIRNCITAFSTMGKALQEIRDQKLYRGKYSSFGEYCTERIGLSRQYAYMLAKAADTHDRVTPLLEAKGIKPIDRERHLRELGRIKDEDDLNDVIDVVAQCMDDKEKEVTYLMIHDAVEAKIKPAVPVDEEAVEAYPDSSDDIAGFNGLAQKAATPIATPSANGNPSGNGSPKFPLTGRAGFKQSLKQVEGERSEESSQEPLVARLREALSHAEHGEVSQAYKILEEILQHRPTEA